ncbi:MAG: NAD(P)/FAD-dependent oxidoreductase [Microcella sp.]|uniref:NAD(P)/FAD-dependent oxidoreductase n=1 Tax=Microcella sp. TaxID=1913979 RepID=UPI003315C89D
MNADLAIVGGGPVGLALALEAHARGLTPVVLEPREGAIDKACGEGLMPGALAALGTLGVDPAGHPIAGIRYRDARREVAHRFAGAPGRGVRRLVLHAALRDRINAVGIEVRAEKAEHIAQDEAGVTVNGMRARWLAGADGLHSRVRDVAGLHRRARGLPPRAPRFGLRRHYAVAPWSDLVEVTYLDDCELYVTPVDDGTVGVAVLGGRPADLDAAIARAPQLRERLDGAASASDLRGAGALRQRSTARTAGRIALVGDASGYVDALTGEGLRVGFAQASVLAERLAADDLPGYERAWARATRDFRLLTAGLLAAATSPARSLIVPTAARLPGVFGAVVERLAR